MNYKPDGWEEIKRLILEEPNGMDKWCCSTCGDKIVELTADAMLEGILQYGHYNVDWSDNDWDIPEVHRGKKGMLVFIPEE